MPIEPCDTSNIQLANWSTVSRLARALPETEEGLSKQGLREWRVKGKLLAWERPLRRADLEALGERAPRGPVLGVFVPDLDTKELLVANRGAIYFTTPHFDGYAIVLVRLGKIGAGELMELLRHAWTARAPKKPTWRSR